MRPKELPLLWLVNWDKEKTYDEDPPTAFIL